MVQPARVELPALTIGQICQIRLIFLELARHMPHGQRLGRIQRPLRVAPVPQIVLVVEQQFREACAGYIVQAQLGL